MSTKTIKRVHLIYGIVLSVLLVVTGVLLMIACISVYRMGDRPFTTENISGAFGKIQIPVYITVGAAIAGLILWLVFPAENQKLKASPDAKAMLERMELRIDLDSCNPGMLTAIGFEKKLRRLLFWIVLGICVAIYVPALIYVLNFDHFGMEDYNGDVIKAVLWLLPSTCFSAGVGIAYVYAVRGSITRETELVKTILANQGKPLPAPKKIVPPENTRLTLGIRIGIAVVAVALIIAGIANGGMADVLAKAINICTECIGLG